MRTLLYAALLVLVSPMPAAAEEPVAQAGGGEEKPEGPPKKPVLVPPKLIQYIQADYPAEALDAGLEAAVVATLDIDEKGAVVGVSISEPAGRGFDEAARAAMERFVFEPATADGKPIGSRVVYRYTFFVRKEEPPPAEAAPLPASLRGKVSDMDGQPITGASVVISPTPDGGAPAITDASGAFAFEGLPAGSYGTDVVAPGFKPFSGVEKLVEGERREVLYRLEVETVLYETVVRARRPPREVTRREVTRREITRIPGTGGDALRSIQNLPGMARAPGLSGDLIVRGSSPQDSLYYFDQMPVPMLYHFGGLTSIINSDLLEQIDFYPGNYGVRYGGATGGIVEVYPKRPATDRPHAYLDADVWDVGALVETPLTKDWSLALSGRRSYIDAILNGVLPRNGGFSFTVAPRYYDYQAIADYHPSRKNNLRLFAFGSDDKLVFLLGKDVPGNPNFSGGGQFGLYFHQLQARWDTQISRVLSNSLNAAAGYQSNDSAFGESFKFRIRAVPVYLRDEVVYDEKGIFALRTGIDSSAGWAQWKIRAPDMIPQEGQPIDPLQANQAVLESTGDRVFYRVAWYGEFEIRPIPTLRIINGVRLEYFDPVDKLGIDPRFVVRYEVVPGTILKGGVGLFHQTPEEWQSDKDFGSTDLELISAIHYSVGVEQKIIENLEIGVEGFYKDISNLVVNSMEMTERNGEPVPERYNNDGRGKVYGLEFLLKQYPTDRMFGWISYTLMRSRRTDHPGEAERRFDYDQTHILTVVASVVLGRGWEAGIRFRLGSGDPETPVNGAIYDSDSDIYLPLYGKPNSRRMPLFHQLDLRIDKKWKWKYVKLAAYIDIYNLYNQNNPMGYNYNYDYTERKYINGLPIIPSFGLKLEY